MAKLRIYNKQTVTVIERSDIVEIDEEDLLELQNWEEFPFKGDPKLELLDHLKAAFRKLSDGEIESDSAPLTILNLWFALETDVTRTQIWNSLHKSGESELVLEDEEEEVIDTAEYSM